MGEETCDHFHSSPHLQKNFYVPCTQVTRADYAANCKVAAVNCKYIHCLDLSAPVTGGPAAKSARDGFGGLRAMPVSFLSPLLGPCAIQDGVRSLLFATCLF